MKNFKGIIPGMFTMGNLACGFASIVTSSMTRSSDSTLATAHLFEAVWLIVLAAFFDFLDGLVARFSKSYSRFGVELDSLTDIVSFAVAPAVLLVSFSLISHGNWAWILGLLFLMAGTFRLARFNISATMEKKSNFVEKINLVKLRLRAMRRISRTSCCGARWGTSSAARISAR